MHAVFVRYRAVSAESSVFLRNTAQDFAIALCFSSIRRGIEFFRKAEGTRKFLYVVYDRFFCDNPKNIEKRLYFRFCFLL